MGFSENFDDFLSAFKNGVPELAQNAFGGFLQQAQADAEAFLEDMRAALKRWAEALKNGQLNKAEFESLLKGQKSLAKLHALTALGLTQTRLERFRTGLLSLITTSLYTSFGI